VDDFILDGLETGIEEMLNDASVPGKHCGRSAIYHLRKAWELEQIDLEMAMFRALTAEEESSTAIIHALRRIKYKGASKLDPERHIHKMSLTSFLDVVEHFLAKLQTPNLVHQLVIEPSEGKNLLRVGFKINHPDHGEVLALPKPPFHGLITDNEVLYDFTNEIQEVVGQKTTSEIKRYLQKHTAMRNVLLYATHEGVPRVTGEIAGFLRNQRRIVFRNLGIFLMIDPYPEKQHLVQQVLQAFLKTLGLLRENISIEPVSTYATTGAGYVVYPSPEKD
jgi:hypothetical protein